jgi:hypothetical protein
MFQASRICAQRFAGGMKGGPESSMRSVRACGNASATRHQWMPAPKPPALMPMTVTRRALGYVAAMRRR